jgi:hypothetical protein
MDLSRKQLGPPTRSSPPPTETIPISSPSTSVVAASPSSVVLVFCPNNDNNDACAHRPSFVSRRERAATMPTTPFDLQDEQPTEDSDYCHDYDWSPVGSYSDLTVKTDGPPNRPQRRPSLRSLDSL